MPPIAKPEPWVPMWYITDSNVLVHVTPKTPNAFAVAKATTDAINRAMHHNPNWS